MSEYIRASTHIECFVYILTILGCTFIYSVAAVSFNPQNYTVSEGSSVELIIVLDQPACQDISVTVTTMDGTAVGECLY